VQSIGPAASPRTKEVFPVVIRKLHELLIEADISITEVLAACELLISAGRASTDVRNEMLLVLDIFGVESLVDTLDTTRAVRHGLQAENPDASASAILGPFYRHGVPVQPNGTTIIRTPEPNALGYTHLHGTVYGADGKPLQGATVDVWHDAPDGLYDAQTPEKPMYHCRGRFETDAQGRYELVCLKPTPYPIPYDEAAGAVLKMMDRHPYRPAHVHVSCASRPQVQTHTSLLTHTNSPSSGSKHQTTKPSSRRSSTRIRTTSRTTPCLPSRTSSSSSTSLSRRDTPGPRGTTARRLTLSLSWTLGCRRRPR
jgi:catechol 1,2-dioxygenase